MNMLWNISLGKVKRGRGVLILDRNGGCSALVKHLVAEFSARHPRMNLYYLGADKASAGATQMDTPWPLDCFRRRVLARLKIQFVVALSSTEADQALLRIAQSSGASVVHAGTEEAAQDGALAAARIVDQTNVQVIPNKHSVNTAGPLPTWWFSHKFRDLETIETMARELQHPSSIMCLGNGPSSEDSALTSFSYDTLFRVNHSWQQREMFNAPQVIFTGQLSTLRAFRAPALFVFQSEDAQQKLLRRAWTLWRNFTYLNAERAGIYDPSQFEPFKPTNGAVMVATAVALAPARIIVAGIDFFSDPRGAYPGSPAAANAYTPAHDREFEARFILSALRGFSGEVKIVGDALLKLWQSNDHTRTRNARKGGMA